MTDPAEHRLIRALRRLPVDRTPVWIMRQAGRYLPEYRRLREQAGDFLTLCKTPDLACEVTLQPLKRFPLDAAILFSDILTIPDAMGLGLVIDEGVGPRFERPIGPGNRISSLPRPDPSTDLAYVMDAIRLIRAELAGSTPLIGFAGSPWTLATYMVEGGASRDFRRAKAMLYDDPDRARRLLALLADAVTDYLTAQIDAGVDAVMVFDTWGGALSGPCYREFSLAYMTRVVEGIRSHSGGRVPVVLFTKGGGLWLDDIADSGCDAVGVDWTVSLADARRQVGARVALQGNLDPAVLLAAPDRIRAEVARILEEFGPGPGHVFNLGHGITPDVDPAAVATLVSAVHELSERSRSAQTPSAGEAGLTRRRSRAAGPAS
jgi:uroporphyrinogen decarboxylase